MKLKPLRDNILTVNIDHPGIVGNIILPEHKSQALLTHGRALVIACGPNAEEMCPPGTIVHVSESWGEEFRVGRKKYRVGRIRDVNGICLGESVPDMNKYQD